MGAEGGASWRPDLCTVDTQHQLQLVLQDVKRIVNYATRFCRSFSYASSSTLNTGRLFSRSLVRFLILAL